MANLYSNSDHANSHPMDLHMPRSCLSSLSSPSAIQQSMASAAAAASFPVTPMSVASMASAVSNAFSQNSAAAAMAMHRSYPFGFPFSAAAAAAAQMCRPMAGMCQPIAKYPFSMLGSPSSGLEALRQTASFIVTMNLQWMRNLPAFTSLPSDDQVSSLTVFAETEAPAELVTPPKQWPPQKRNFSKRGST